jgi:hypothetical protein
MNIHLTGSIQMGQLFLYLWNSDIKITSPYTPLLARLEP